MKDQLPITYLAAFSLLNLFLCLQTSRVQQWQVRLFCKDDSFRSRMLKAYYTNATYGLFIKFCTFLMFAVSFYVVVVRVAAG